MCVLRLFCGEACIPREPPNLIAVAELGIDAARMGRLTPPPS
jgi:hypothetical protein